MSVRLSGYEPADAGGRKEGPLSVCDYSLSGNKRNGFIRLSVSRTNSCVKLHKKMPSSY